MEDRVEGKWKIIVYCIFYKSEWEIRGRLIQEQSFCQLTIQTLFISAIIPHLIIMFTRPWPAFGRQGLVGSSFEYSYTRIASRLRRSARSGIMTLGKDKTPSLLEPSNLSIFQPSNLPTFRPSNLPTFPKRQCLETGRIDQIL